MKRVVTNSRLPHLWMYPREERDSARSSNGNFYFEGDTIYSYGSHFPIARHVTNERGEQAVFFTSNSYGCTTAQHKSEVMRAIPAGHAVFVVPSVHSYATEERALRPEHIEENYLHYAQQLKERALEIAKKGRQMKNRVWDLNRLRSHLLPEANAFADFVDRPRFADPTLAPDFADMLKRIEDYAEHEAEILAAQEIVRAKKEAERERVAKLEYAEQISLWREGRDVGYLPQLSTDMLRVKGMTVQTSRGVVVPLDEAQKMLSYIKRVWASGLGYQRAGGFDAVMVGAFVLHSIDAETGFTTIGCHRFTKEEIELVAPSIERADGYTNDQIESMTEN